MPAQLVMHTAAALRGSHQDRQKLQQCCHDPAAPACFETLAKNNPTAIYNAYYLDVDAC